MDNKSHWIPWAYFPTSKKSFINLKIFKCCPELTWHVHEITKRRIRWGIVGSLFVPFAIPLFLLVWLVERMDAVLDVTATFMVVKCARPLQGPSSSDVTRRANNTLSPYKVRTRLEVYAKTIS